MLFRRKKPEATDSQQDRLISNRARVQRSDTKNSPCCMIPFIEKSRKHKLIYSDRKPMNRTGEGSGGRSPSQDVGSEWNIPCLDGVMVPYTRTSQLIALPLTCVQCTVCQLQFPEPAVIKGGSRGLLTTCNNVFRSDRGHWGTLSSPRPAETRTEGSADGVMRFLGFSFQEPRTWGRESVTQ